MDYTNLFSELEQVEQYIFNEIEDELKIKYSELFSLHYSDLSYNDLVNRYAKILYFWSSHMPDFSDIENGDINATFKWLYIQNRMITLLRRIKKFNSNFQGNILHLILDRYVLLLLT